MENGVKSIQAAAYKGARTVIKTHGPIEKKLVIFFSSLNILKPCKEVTEAIEVIGAVEFIMADGAIEAVEATEVVR